MVRCPFRYDTFTEKKKQVDLKIDGPITNCTMGAVPCIFCFCIWSLKEMELCMKSDTWCFNFDEENGVYSERSLYTDHLRQVSLQVGWAEYSHT